MNRLALATLTSALLAACGSGPTDTGETEDRTFRYEPAPTRAVSCEVGDVKIGDGATRVSRTAALDFGVEAPPADLAIWVAGPDGKQVGEIYLDAGRAHFMPRDPYPAGSTMTWNVELCGETHSGTFEVGSLLHPVGDDKIDANHVGHSFAVDLRAASWNAPATTSRLTMRLGGSLVVDVLEGLQKAGLEIPVVAGGIIPDEDARKLRDAGVARVYTPKDYDLVRIMDELVDVVAEAHGDS